MSRSVKTADDLIAEGHDLEDAGLLREALERYLEAERLSPAHARAKLNIGNALRGLGRLDEAEAAYGEAIALEPTQVFARSNLAALLITCGRHDEAEQHLRSALAIRSDLAELYIHLANVLEQRRELPGAEAALREALRLDPDSEGASVNLGQILLREDRFDDALKLMSRSIAIAPDALSFMLFDLNNRTDLSPAEVARRHREVGAELQALAPAPYTAWPNPPEPHRRLKIGYVSADLRMHPVGMFMKPVIENHDASRFEIVIYSNARQEDRITAALRAMTTAWKRVVDLSNQELAALVRQDGIDILIDLGGHTSNNRLLAFARHPAPVQATWLGYLNTTGMETIDYRICDAHTDPPGELDAMYSERLYRLPFSQWCYSPWFVDGTPSARPEGRFRFGSPNSSSKISDYSLRLWSRILAGVSNSQIVVLDVPSAARQRMAERMGSAGIDPARVVFRERLPIDTYYQALCGFDIALDTQPYNGATTTLDTLWMGTPVVALAGNRSAARGTLSILTVLGLADLIASDEEDYVRRNVALARDTALRSSLRQTLRERLKRSPLMDAPAFVRDLELAYRSMWQAWCNGCRYAPVRTGR